MSWLPVTLNMSRAATTVTQYGIWRSTQPYFDPDAMNCNCAKIGETVGLSFPDSGPIGDVANNYFYVVRAENSAGWSPVSNRTGEFDFALTPGGQ